MFSPFAVSQKIIENSSKPPGEKAGRIVKLKEVLKVTDEGGEFYFKFPRNLKISYDGSIFIQDENQLLQFHSDGKFIRNLFKKGKGPGEMEYLSNYVLMQNRIIVHNMLPQKILWFDYDGKLAKELRMDTDYRSFSLFSVSGNLYYFVKSEYPAFEKESEIIDGTNMFIRFNPDNNEMEELMDFPTKIWRVKHGTGQGTRALNDLILAKYDNGLIFLNHTHEYLVKLCDIESNKLICAFRREYKRIRPQDEVKRDRREEWEIGGKRFKIPYPEYLNDIRMLLVHRGRLWMVTSTLNKKKGFLVDVFNRDGEYVDNFYLRLSDNPSYDSLGEIFVYGDFLYQIRKDEEDLCQIMKYEILDEH